MLEHALLGCLAYLQLLGSFIAALVHLTEECVDHVVGSLCQHLDLFVFQIAHNYTHSLARRAELDNFEHFELKDLEEVTA